MKKTGLQNTTAVIISFMRVEYTKACIESLKRTYPEIKVLVAENAEYNEDLKDFVNSHGGKYVLMPFDSGVCYARNRLIELADTDFVLVGDDDFYYEDSASVEKMVKFLQKHKTYSLVGGRIKEKGRILNYQGSIDIHPDHFHYHVLDHAKNRLCKASGLHYQKCDITFNFFVARKNHILNIKWDEKIKVAYEHSDWFISVKKAGGRKVAFAEEAIVIHKPEQITVPKLKMDQYKQYRHRRSDMHYFFRKHGIKYSIGFRGTKYNFNDVKQLKNKYYATVTMTFDGRTYNAGDIIVTDRPNEFMRACI